MSATITGRSPARVPGQAGRGETGEIAPVHTGQQPTTELVRCNRRGGIDFDKLEAARRRLGIEGVGEGWPEEFNDPAFSRKVPGLDEE